ncbi:MAG: PQQ-dependent sugar dehydrogenase, partial [Saprospiraceae bacterium]
MKYFLFLLSILVISCSPKQNNKAITKTNLNDEIHEWDASFPLDKIKLPDGFKIEIFAKDVKNARSICLSPSGTLFVGTRGKGNVYAIKDTDGDYRADEIHTIAKGLRMPNGVAFKDGDLYVACVSKVLKFKDIENNLENPPTPETIIDEYPTERSHGWKYIAFGPDEKLYIPVGAPCNICDSEDKIFASMTRIDVNKKNLKRNDIEIVQHGIRNSVGFDWHPKTGEMWFTENGRDWLGDDSPACELNHAPKEQMHFGYPYCHQGDTLDPEFGKGKNCDDYTKPVQKLGPHVAPLGIEFYEGNQFPETYKNQPILAEHGSWNRSTKIGYRLMMIPLDGNMSK